MNCSNAQNVEQIQIKHKSAKYKEYQCTEYSTNANKAPMLKFKESIAQMHRIPMHRT